MNSRLRVDAILKVDKYLQKSFGETTEVAEKEEASPEKLKTELEKLKEKLAEIEKKIKEEAGAEGIGAEPTDEPSIPPVGLKTALEGRAEKKPKEEMYGAFA